MLIIRALALGDLLTAVPALRALRRAYPDSELILAAPRWLAPLIPLAGAVDVLRDTPDLAAIQPAGPSPDLVVNLHGSGPQSIAAAARLGPVRILSHANPHFPRLAGPAWIPELHEVDRWCRLVRWAGFAADRDDLALIRPTTPALAAGVVVIHPGASAAARRWPAGRFAAVAAALADRGSTVLITGSAIERPLADQVVTTALRERVRSVAGLLALDELAALVASARLVISGDTGVAHLASAYATPSVVLFGPTPPKLWGPPVAGPHLSLWSGQRGDPHAERCDAGLLRIDVDDVLAAVELLSVTARPTG